MRPTVEEIENFMGKMHMVATRETVDEAYNDMKHDVENGGNVMLSAVIWLNTYIEMVAKSLYDANMEWKGEEE